MLYPNKVTRYRKLRGLSQGELAKIIGLSQCYINLVENGKRIPSFKAAILIAKVLKKEVPELFNLTAIGKTLIKKEKVK